MPGEVGWDAPAAGDGLRQVLVDAGVRLSAELPDGGPVITVAAGEDDGARLAQLSLSAPGRVIVLADDTLSEGEQWALLHAGASDVICTGDDMVARLQARLERWRIVDEHLGTARQRIVGTSRALLRALRTTVEAARFTDAPILLLGESGSGKELLARLVHQVVAPPGELVLLDCSTIVPDLSGSEFFGHERGAFTGAVAPRDGAFARADDGTLFLDEVGELPLSLQPELLRAVQEGTYKRVGGNTWRRTRFRLVCATNRDLAAEVRAGRFREDLYFRLAAWPCEVPSLADRPEDILPLARHFLAEAGVRAPVSDGVSRYLLRRDYPGNIRELRQVVGRIATKHVGCGPVRLGDIPPEDRPVVTEDRGWPDEALRRSLDKALATDVGLEAIKRTVADTAVALAFDRAGGRTADAAALLGVSTRALQHRRARRTPA